MDPFTQVRSLCNSSPAMMCKSKEKPPSEGLPMINLLTRLHPFIHLLDTFICENSAPGTTPDTSEQWADSPLPSAELPK